MTEPVGPQYGLNPRFDHTPVRIPPDSRDIVSDIPYDDLSAGEFSGVAGRIAPPPHVPTSSERLGMIYAIDPTDDGTEPESVLPPELDGNFNTR
jgi:hypothetical protein